MIYHPYGNIDPFKISETADKLLNEYWDIAESLGSKPFLLYGTCLGFVRDGGYIEGDNDLDVGILEREDELIAKLIENGFINKARSVENIHFVKYNILIDVFFAFPDRKFLQSFDEIIYNGRAFNVPHPVEEYLKMKYGDWKAIKHREVYG